MKLQLALNLIIFFQHPLLASDVCACPELVSEESAIKIAAEKVAKSKKQIIALDKVGQIVRLADFAEFFSPEDASKDLLPCPHEDLAHFCPMKRKTLYKITYKNDYHQTCDNTIELTTMINNWHYRLLYTPKCN